MFTYNDIFLSFSLQGDQVQNNLDKMETGAGKVACRGARVNIGDMDEMVSTKSIFKFFLVFFYGRVILVA